MGAGPRQPGDSSPRMKRVTTHSEENLAGFCKKTIRSTADGFVSIVPLWKLPLSIMATSNTTAINVSAITGGTYGSFDWQTMVTQIIQADSAPVTALQAQETANQAQISSLSTLNTDLTQLQTYAQALQSPSLFTGRTTSVSDANWTATAANATAPGSYTIAVTNLATAASRIGSANIASPLLTLASLSTATPITAGTFTVNGQTVTVAPTDSLQEVFNKISTATGGTVTASYNPGTDGITLTNTDSSDPTGIDLGAVGDSSNFLQATQLATNGTNTVSSASSLGVSGLTLATLATASPITAGTFTVNGQTVTIALTDSLQDVFNKISTATGGALTASYNPATDGITLANTDPSSTSEIVLGAVNDSSNFLQVMQLANNGTDTVSSSNPLGAVAINTPLAQANLSTAITAVDGSGNGSFTINGVSIAYNINTDSLATVMNRINASSAGVTATYNSATGQVVLTNNSTGNIGLGANDVASAGQVGLLSALGLTSGSTLQHGQNAVFTVNNGAPITSASNTLTGTVLGIPGLSVTATTATTQTVTVAANVNAMETAIQNFAGQYNTVQSYITQQTAFTTNSDGSVTAGTLANDLDIPNWASDLQSLIFAPVPGLSGAVKQLSDLGLDFDSTGQMIVSDTTQLTNVLTNNSADVAAYFSQASTGMASSVNSYLNNLLLPNTGGLALINNGLVSSDTDLASQITTLQAQLTQEQNTLTTAFEAMQSAQTTAQSQLNYLNAVANLNKSS